MRASASFGGGQNGFGRSTYVYGLGVEKVWNGHDHGNGPEFCTGAVMLRSEFVGRWAQGVSEDGDRVNFDDYGLSTELLYGLSDRCTVSLRHGWVSGVEMAELDDRHRISTALTTYLGQAQRIRARLQYDYTHTVALDVEHAAWLQFMIQWGGIGGSHAGHNH